MAYAKVCKGYALTNGCQTKIATLLDQQQYIYTNAESVSPPLSLKFIVSDKLNAGREIRERQSPIATLLSSRSWPIGLT